MTNYKTSKTFEDRLKESDEIINKYPTRIPLIVDKLSNNNDTIIPNIDKNKYLVPEDLTIGQLIYVIRKRIKITPEKAIFIFCNDKLLNSSVLRVGHVEGCEDGNHSRRDFCKCCHRVVCLIVCV